MKKDIMIDIMKKRWYNENIWSFILKYYKWGHKENCNDGNDVRFTFLKGVTKTNDVYATKGNKSSLRFFLCKNNLRKLVIGQLNINSLRNKFVLLIYQIKDNFGTQIIMEIKVGESFPIGHVFIN